MRTLSAEDRPQVMFDLVWYLRGSLSSLMTRKMGVSTLLAISLMIKFKVDIFFFYQLSSLFVMLCLSLRGLFVLCLILFGLDFVEDVTMCCVLHEQHGLYHIHEYEDFLGNLMFDAFFEFSVYLEGICMLSFA